MATTRVSRHSYHLHGAWTAGPLDGALYAEPLLDGDNVIVATEDDSVYDFDAVSGRQLWRDTLGTPRTSNFPCGDIKPLGITGTPVIDGGVCTCSRRSRTHLACIDSALRS